MRDVLGEIRNVTRKVADREILAEVSFDIAAGTCVVLEGANGAGKTTLLRILLGRDAPTSGSVWFDGEAVPGQSIAAVMQTPPFFENLTVLEHLQFVQASWGIPADDARPSVLPAELGIERIADSFPDELSSGERQLVALCFGLLRPAALLVLDEPEQRLDVERRAAVGRILAQRKREGLTIVMATHDRQFVDELADQAVRLEIPA